MLLVGGLLCARLALHIDSARPARTAALLILALALFAVSHPLGHAIGAWPAVIVTAALVAAASAALARGGH